jgi:hypothetical protein
MRIYHNPAIQDKLNNIGRWFAGPYKFLVVEDEERITLMLFKSGAIFSINLE